MNKALKQIVVLAVPPVTELDFIGPLSVFQHANQVLALQGRKPAYKFKIATSSTNLELKGYCGTTLKANCHYTKLRGFIDTLIIPAGGVLKQGTVVSKKDPILSWLQNKAPKVRRLASICAGAFFLAQANLLNGKRATTHWALCQQLVRYYPEVLVDDKPIFIQDGAIFTSAGATAGIDLALHLVESDLGNSVASQVARGLVVYLHRPGGQAPFSIPYSPQAPTPKLLVKLQQWIVNHLQENLTVERLADHVSMSPRHFSRIFVKEFGLTPAKYVLLQRLEAARQKLEQSEASQESIMRTSGFGSMEQMRRIFLQELGVTPGRYRDHFQRRANPSER